MSFILLWLELFLSFVSPLIMSVTIDSVLGSEPLKTPEYFAWFIRAVGGVDFIKKNLWIMALAMVGMQVMRGGLSFLRAYANNKAGEGSTKKLRDRFYAHMQKLPFSYHASVMTGDLIQRATNDIDTLRRFIAGGALELLRTLLLFVVGMFVMFSLSVKLSLIAVCLAPAIVVLSMLFFSKIQKMYEEMEKKEGKLFTIIQENLTGSRVVRAFGRQRFELDKFMDGNEDMRKITLKLNAMFAYMWSSLDVISGLQIVLVAVFGIFFAVRGDLTLGEYTAFTSYVYIFIWPLRNLGRSLTNLSRTYVAAGRIDEVLKLDEEDEVPDGAEPPLGGDIVFENVIFGYEASNRVFDGLNMTIKGGTTAAILGGTGSGKSSLIQLLQRLYDLQDGRITIGGEDITKIKKSWLRGKISIVLQEPFLYSKTILRNIGIKLETPDRETVTDAAKIAAVHDDIESFEQGYETVVGERGVTLSGGQKQRVAIARSLVNDSAVLIFDDSLSAVDTHTDAMIRSALSSRRKGVTTIIISHRIATLREADRIYVLKDGKVAEEGTHEELMACDGIYRRTCDIQSAQTE